MIVLGVVLVLLALHPLTTYPLSLLVWRQVKPAPVGRGPTTRPAISFLCCAHNEAAVITEKAENSIRLIDGYSGSAEVLFFLDACDDGTAEALAPYRNRITIVESADSVGKSVGMSRLVAAATGEILVFTDANTMIDAGAFEAFADEFSDPAVGCVCSHLSITNEDASETAQVNGAYWRLEELIKRLESATGSTVSADGALFAIRREFYAPTPPAIIDDMYTSMSALLAGARVIVSKTVQAEERTATRRDDEFRRKVRIACRAFNCYRYLARRLHRSGAEINYKFYSHKVLRWLSLPIGLAGVAFLLLGLLLSHQAALAAALFIIGAGSLLLGWLRLKPFSAVFEVFLAHWAVTLGVIDSLRGRVYQTWVPAISGR
jgi:cellulose synthase/poly-beta-1,6-N-acetylglucosamine synthase-like glycosyltransferase